MSDDDEGVFDWYPADSGEDYYVCYQKSKYKLGDGAEGEASLFGCVEQGHDYKYEDGE